MLKKFITSALAAGLVLTGAAALPEGAVSFDNAIIAQASKVSGSGFTMNIDSAKWENVASSIGADFAYRYIGDSSDANYATASFNVISTSSSALNKNNFSDFMDTLKQTYMNQGNTVTSCSANSSLNGYSAGKISMDMTSSNGMSLKAVIYTVPDYKNGKVYAITYGSQSSVFSKMSSEFNKVIGTFSLNSDPHSSKASVTKKKSIKKAKLTVSDRTYTGKALRPKVTVKLGSTVLTKSTSYTVTFKNNKNIGKATVIVKGKGAYTGTVKKTFKITPVKSKVTKVASTKAKTAKVTFKKVSNATGYEVKYSTKKNFTKATSKTVTVKGAKKSSTTLNKLTSGKTYYVKVRTYKTVKGKKYYSKFSAVKSIKVK